MSPRLKGLLGWAAGGYAAVIAGTYAIQRQIIYPAPADALRPSVPGGVLHEIPGPHRIAYALHIPAEGDAPTLVHFHGNGETLADQTDLAAALHRGGLGVFAVEYPGYGLARGAQPTEATLYEDATVTIQYLRDTLGVSRERTVLQGQSLGTAVAVEMARQGLGARLVLIAPFTSMTDMVRRVAPVLPAALIVDDRYDSLAKAPGISLPVFVIHGTADEVIPVSMGKRLAETFPDARLDLVPGAHHNDLFVVDGRRILEQIVAFARG
jgi:uncharacterized protein